MAGQVSAWARVFARPGGGERGGWGWPTGAAWRLPPLPLWSESSWRATSLARIIAGDSLHRVWSPALSAPRPILKRAIAACPLSRRYSVTPGHGRLICACRDRRSAVRRMVPLTPDESRGSVHRSDGDRSCSGERPGRPPARAGALVPPGGCRGGGAARACWHRGSASHLGPDEPGELAGDRADGLGGGLAAGGHRAVLAVQPPLRPARWGTAASPRPRRPG